jgi:hypothetical protein
MPETSHALGYHNALSILERAGVLKVISTRDGRTVADFPDSSITISDATVTDTKVTEKDRIQMFGHLLAVAADRGMQPAELLAIGMATVLQEGH